MEVHLLGEATYCCVHTTEPACLLRDTNCRDISSTPDRHHRAVTAAQYQFRHPCLVKTTAQRPCVDQQTAHILPRKHAVGRQGEIALCWLFRRGPS